MMQMKETMIKAIGRSRGQFQAKDKPLARVISRACEVKI